MTVPRRADRPLRCVKYVILAVFVVLLPMLAKNEFGISKPFFCQFICPAGTLQGGVPLMLTNSALRRLAGALFSWKMLVLVLVLISAVLIPRSFCRYLCPLGAFYAVFNRYSFYQLTSDRSTCTGCNTCERVCPMATTVSSPECIRCGRCKAACPTGSIKGMIAVKGCPHEEA